MDGPARPLKNGGSDMEKKVEDELNMLKEIILNTVPVEQIILFGSYAEGTPHADSDLDIYVVMPDSADIRDIDAMQEISLAMVDRIEMPVDLVVSKRTNFSQRRAAPTIERHIAENGIVLYG
jgi:predicted nucleotidyltransferase